MNQLFSTWNINRYFKIPSPIKNTNGVIEDPPEYLKKVAEDQNITYEKLMQKHKTTNPRESLKLEMAEIKNNFKPSQEGLEYLDQINEAYKGKTIKFYYTDPMLNHFGINDPDCDHIPIYEVLCEGIDFIEDEKLPLILTKDKNYSLVDVVEIAIIEKKKGSDE